MLATRLSPALEKPGPNASLLRYVGNLFGERKGAMSATVKMVVMANSTRDRQQI
jgi:hypothetical protein